MLTPIQYRDRILYTEATHVSMGSLQSLVLYLVTSLLFLTPTNPIEPVPQAADADTVVNADTSKSIRLDANLLIPDGGELLLNIQVPHEPIQIHPKGPAKVSRVYSDHVDGKLGVGEVINIFVKFTSPVKLSGAGTPYIVLKTGCHATSCHVKEIQRLRCMATKGKFAVGFGSQKVGNIPWDASAKLFAAYLRRMNRINKVNVKYSIDEDRACTFFGNNITITFDSMNIAGTDGDLVELTGDTTNAVGDGVVLGHVLYTPLVTSTAWEIRKGVLVPDRKAFFVAQTAPDTLKFGYTVQKGDNSTRLEYVNSDSLALSLRSIGGVRIVNDDDTNTIANCILPPPGFEGDWERGIGTSLSKSNALEIDVTPPYVTTVTSPHEDGTFGIGEVILVHVHFSQPIVVTGLPTVVLETGAVDRIIPFNQVVAGNIAEFKYIVQAMDTSPDLTYTGTTALQLNGGSIKRKSTTPTTNAVLKLPFNGESGSLSVSKNMVIDTTKPKIVSVTTTAKDGIYTAGDDIPVIITFDTPVVVSGTPQLVLSTGSVDLFPGQFVLEAPTFTSNETVVFPSYYLGLSTQSSKGLQFKIDGQILTVDSVNRDEVTMIEKYTGTKVEPVTLSNRANVPIYSPGYRPAKYSSGSGTKMLTFVYTVQIGDVSNRLAYLSTSALQLGSGSIKRLSTTPFTNADLTLATPGTSGSLSAGAALGINTDAPRVTQVKAVTRDGVYKAGDEIYFEVVFNLPVVVSPTASLVTNIVSAGVERLAIYSDGSGTTSLKFKFDCLEDDQVTVLDVKNVNSLRASYGSILGWIRRKSAAPMLPALLDLPVSGLSSKGISINQGCETVTDVFTSHEEGTYGVGESIDLLVKYFASVSVDTTGGIPTLVTSTGNSAVYQSGTGTQTLVFNYVVQQSDISGRLVYPDRYSLKTNGAVIKGVTSSALSSTLLPSPELSQLKTKDNLFIQTSPPVVVEVSTRTQDRVITVGDTIVVLVSFNYPIYVPPLSVKAGAPTLLLNVGTGSGIASSYVAAEENAAYFSFTVAADQSTSKLSYFGRSALKCTGGNGLNKDPRQSAGPPSAVLFGDVFFTSWAEMSSTTNTRQIRVKSFDLQQFPPLLSFEDGGEVLSIVNLDSTMDATSPELVTFSSKLYLVWVEASTAPNNPTQIRVAVLASRSPVQWAFVDAKPATNFGINKVPTANAAEPHAVVHDSKLYIAWNENPSGVAQIRVAVFNGHDSTPGWTYSDGNQNARGLNYAALQSAQSVRLCSCGSKGSMTNNLYAAWSEISTLSGTAQIRVAVQTGTDSLPNWRFIDGNTATGLNIGTQKIAISPSIQCIGGSSVAVGWQETTGATGSVIFIKKFNGDFTTPQWIRLGGDKGLNFDATQPAQNLKLSVQLLGTTETLFATWDEADSTGTATQIRVAQLLTGANSWKFLDGGAKISVINDDVSHSASRPVLVCKKSRDTTIAAWLETHSNGKNHIRCSVLDASVNEWQPLSQGCILRKATSSVTSANLLLPELNSPGSLDFGHSIRVETSKPKVQSVSLAGDIYSSITSVSTIQTVDIFNVASIKQGDYELVYGDTKTSCISWNAPATGTGSIQSALESMTGLAIKVSVTQDTTSFHDGYRYTITFVFPTMGILPLQVKKNPDAKCKKFTCDPTLTRFPCNLDLVQPNQNSDIRATAGVVDAVVRFSFPVVIPIGIPKLSIDTGVTVRDAIYMTRSALQEFDVGINMASSVLGGGFRLSYGDFSSGVGVAPIYTTDCIQLLINDDDGVQEMQSKLEEIALIKTIGIRSVSRRKYRNGYRFTIENRNSGDMLDLVPADSSTCPAIAASTQTIDIKADTEILSGEIKIQLGDTKSGCIPWNVRAKGPSNSMEAIMKYLEGDRIIPVQVVKDPSVYVHGIKYYVRFSNLVDANSPLLAFMDATCATFTCKLAGGATGACTSLSVTSNADFKVTRAESGAISFRYLVQPSDEAISLMYKSTTSLTGTILRSSKNPILAASLTLPPPTALVAQDGVTSMAVVRSDTIPVVTRVYSTTVDDTYTAGDVIIVIAEFSEKVIVEGKPVLELDSKGEAFYTSGSGTNVLKFYYEVKPGEATADLNYASVAALRTFTVPNSKIICALCSGSGIDADTTLPALHSAASLAGNNALVIDTTVPIVTLITSSRPGTAAGGVGYGPGDIVDIMVTFSTDVAVTGTPSLTLNSGGTAKFTYAGYRQLLDIGVNAVVPVTSGQFAVIFDGKVSGCIDFDDASSVAATSLKTRLLEFKAIARIGILSVTMTKKKNGNRFEILFDSTKVVDVPLAIELTVSDMCDPLQPSSAAQETLVSRVTDNQIVFHYTVGVGDTTAVLGVTSTSISLNSGTDSILRQSGSPVIVANVALPISTSPQSLAQTKNLKIDGIPAQISDVISDSAAGTYGVGFPALASPLTVAPGEILLHLVFTRPVVVIGTPAVELATGSLRPSGEFIPNRLAKFINQPQPNHVAFLYHIEPDDYSTNLAFPNVSVLNGANIYCASSTMSVRASLVLPKLTISNGIIKIDAFSVPATVKLASSHEDGEYGAGELIEIQVSFSKQIVLLSGLNRNQDWHARYPVALEFKRNIYIMWTERDDMQAPSKSFLYLRVFSSDTLDVVATTSVSAVNRVPNTFIEKVAMTVWKQNLYAAWDEGGLLYCALFEGIPSINPWTLIPNMGINKNMAMAASDPALLVYNLELVVVWREKALPVGSSALVGQIRVAVLNYDIDAPLWIFHDGNQLDSGLNKNKLMDADDPATVVYRGRMYVSWTEMNKDGAYEIVIARRNIQTRDFSTWTYLDALPSSYPAYSFLSAYKPQFTVRRKGIEDMALLISWYRDTVTSNVSEVITGQVLDLDWEASVTGSIPQTINAAEGNTTVDKVNPNSIEQKFVTCGDNIYSSWLDLEGNNDEDAAYVLKFATLPPGAHVYTGWTSAVNQSNLNHNPKRDAIDSSLVCSTSSNGNPHPGLVWTEYDGYSIKLRFRHYTVVPRTPGTTSTYYGETIAGAPVLMLATQSNPLGYAACIDKSGITTTMLSFTYIVQPGESSPQLEIMGQDALKLNGAVIRDIAGKDPDFTLFPDSANLRSLSYNSKLAINTTPPTVLSVTSKNPSGEYGVGQILEIQVTFSCPVVVIKGDPATPPTLSLRSDELHLLTSSQGIATYAGGSGSSVLTFEYTTGLQDYCEQLDYMDTASLALHGSTWAIKRNATRPTTDAVLTLPPIKSANSLSGSRTIVIKSTQPSVVKVTSSTPDGTYYPGDIVLVDVLFSLPVFVFGFPVLLLETGGNAPTRSSLRSGNGTDKLTFEYGIKVGDKSARLDVVDDRVGDDKAYFVMSLMLEGYAEIKRASTNPFTTAVAALPAPGLTGSLSFSKNIIVDSTPPTIIDIRSPVIDGTYDIGEQIDFLLVFSRQVVVTSIPEVILNVPSEYSRTAVYTDGSGTSILRFSYFPKVGDNSRNLALDILDENSLILRPLLRGKELLQNPAEILCSSSNPVLRADIKLPIPGVAVRSDAVLSLVGNNRKIFVRTDGFRVKAIQADIPSGIYSPGQRIVISVVFTGPTVVQGSPRLKLNSNTAAYAVYIGGTGTSKLRFEYIVATGDSCSVLEAASRGALELNGGVISDTGGIYVPLRLGIPTQPGSLSDDYNIEITSAPPSVLHVYCKDGDGSYGVGDTLHIAVVFSRKVTLSNPPPLLLLQVDVGTRAATYLSGDKTDTLEFTLQILNGDSTALLDYASKNALTGTILALSTTPTTAANLELPVPGAEGSLADSTSIRVISTPPVIMDVRAVSRDGNYGLYDNLRIQIRFSFPVYVSPVASQTCTLTLAVGDVEFRKAIYVGGSTTTKMEFEYIVQNGDRSSRLDYIGANSLHCTILQATAVPSLQASRILPLPGAEGSLSYNSALQIDAFSPRITSVSSGTENGVYGAGQVIDIAITFSEAVLVPSGAKPRLRLAIASNVPVDTLIESSIEPYATYNGGSGSSVLKFVFTVRVGDIALPLEYAGIDALSMTIHSAQLTAVEKIYRFASIRLPVPGATGSLSNNRDIHIDTLETPRVIGVGSLTANGIYTAGDTLTISVTFSTPVTVTGSPPTLLLNTGNPDTQDSAKKAVYVAGSGTSVLLFEYKVQIGDSVDRLEYKPCSLSERNAFIQRKWDKLVRCSSTANALQLGGIGSSIKRSSTVPVTDAVLDLPEVNDWAELRVATTGDNFVYVTQVEPTTGAEKSTLKLLENEFSISHQKAAINIYSNGIPSHDTILHEKIKEQKYFIELQRFPTLQSQILNLSRIPDAFSGIFLNGILFKNSNKRAKSTDDCGGAINADGHYFYVDLPKCYLAAIHEPREPKVSLTGQIKRPMSVVVAYALDGFPIYGYYDEDGELPSDLDECHGHIRRDGQYAYHLIPPETSASPFMPCLRGLASTSQLSVFRYPADISAVEGLPLSELAKFNSFVIDENPATYNADTWLNPESVSVVYTSTTVIVRSNGMPAGTYGPFPNAYNRFSVYEQDYDFQFPRNPVIAATTTSLPRDTPIGVMVNGVPFFAAKSDVYGGIVVDITNSAYILLDKCNGLVDAGGDYRYYASPDCLLHELGDKVGQPSPLIGFAFDGFPLYGPYGENGQMPNALDACNGRVGDDGTYRYHVTLTAPYLLGCFRGTPAIDQKNLYAANDLYRSLSYAHALRINTDRPQVTHVFTNKRPGVYVTGESIDVVVEWSTPVQVIGTPTISILNSSRVATYDATRSSAQQTVFLYVVNRNDVNIEDFSYDAHVAIQLNGGRVARFATIPILDADLDLIPSDLDNIDLIRSRTPGLSSKFQLVRDLRVVLRGLYHPRAHDLRARVFHGNRESIIFDGCCTARDAFGIPDVPDVLTNRAQLASEARNPTSGIGWDYSFSDFNGDKNLALDGGATALQSSTSDTCGPMNAIDGRIRGVDVSTQTVVRTLPAKGVNESAWWELRLVDVATVGTIRIWIADSDPTVAADVFMLRVDSSDGVSTVTGDFTLIFTTQDNKQLETESISYNAVAMIADEKARIISSGIGRGESIQAKLLALGDIVPRLVIKRDPRDASLSRNGAFTWHITFLDNSRAALSVGVNNVSSGTGIVNVGPPLSIDDDSDPIVYRKGEAAKPSASTSVRATEQSMFPFWVLLFDSSAVMDVESFADAYARAIFSYRVDERHANRSVISVVPPLGTKAQYVRVVAELPRGVISIAEVEVFTEQSHVLSQYAGGTPVRTAYHPGSKTWSPEEPFRYTFSGMPSEGSWTLAIEDMAVNGSNLSSPKLNSTAGGMSDWVLYITNQAGETVSYYMDFQAQLHALPRHGTLYVGLDETERDHLDIDRNGLLDSIEADTYLRRYSPNSYSDLSANIRDRELKEFMLSYEEYGAVQVLRDSSERQLRLPSRVCNAECLAAIKLDPYFYVGLEGDKALKLLRVVGDRVVKYVPDAGFRGLDAFTFSVAVTGHESRVLGTIQLTVKECEDAECRMSSFLLHRSTR
ncbi:hypothetical protein F444_21239 [Phytophthora nicotianae P1976]|uniref:YHYH domain-containing protein n=1 Tax=Phytophthora nicotianae P1976 TaxID=1317066 RepID=A0A080Z1T1_PHYNI|nr:hypothetical protein F444_21239 [Phytophthora nicotianae P1976]